MSHCTLDGVSQLGVKNALEYSRDELDVYFR